MEIEARRSTKGGYTRDALAEMGVPWPPPKGWKKRLLAGLDFADAEAQRAEAVSAGPSPVHVRDLGTVDPLDPPPWL